MVLGANLQYLRRQAGGMTQEKLAERMGVSRQTVSKWEMDEAYPEIDKLMELCDIFNCKLDALLRENMRASNDAYSEIRIETVKAFRMARYVIISPRPEDDSQEYMKAWARRNGLMDIPGREPKCIGWDFPFVSAEQQNRFGLRGYVTAYILPEGFEPREGGAEIACQQEARYAVVTIRDPFLAPFERIPGAYKLILNYLDASGFKRNLKPDCLPCFERVHEQDGVTYMDVYVQADSVGKADIYSAIR